MNSHYFLANLSHQLRNPIGGIVGHTQLLLQTRLDSTQKTYLNIVNRCCVQLAELVSDILDFTKLASGHAELHNECFKLSDVMEEVQNTVGCRINEKNQRLHISIDSAIPEYIITDKSKLTQIIINLVSNANKFTQNGGRIVLSAKCIDTNRLEFSVDDNGVGIPVEEQEKLFNPFVQLHDAVKGGSGLGLAIAKKLTQLLGGDIRVESAKGEGATFIFTVLYGIEEKEKEPECVKGKYILIIDSNVDNRVNIGDVLFECGARPIICSSTKEGLKLLNKGRYPFSAVLLGGSEDAILINSMREANAEMRIICIRGAQTPSALFDDFIHSPVNRTELLNVLKKALSSESCVELNQRDPRECIHKSKEELNVLIVEDEPYNLSMLSKMLHSMGYAKIETATNGEEAIDKLKKSNFDILLLDLKMPKGDGFYVLENMQNKNVAVSVITASVLESDKERCRKLGVRYFLLKPFNMTHLKLLMHKLLYGTK